MGLIGKIGGQPDFNAWRPGGLPFGAWVTAVISFLIISAVVYFLIVKPYTVAKEKYFPAEEHRHAGRRRAARGDPRPAGLAPGPGLAASSPWCGGTCALIHSSSPSGRVCGSAASSLVCSGSTSPKTSASRRRRFSRSSGVSGFSLIGVSCGSMPRDLRAPRRASRRRTWAGSHASRSGRRSGRCTPAASGTAARGAGRSASDRTSPMKAADSTPAASAYPCTRSRRCTGSAPTL